MPPSSNNKKKKKNNSNAQKKKEKALKMQAKKELEGAVTALTSLDESLKTIVKAPAVTAPVATTTPTLPVWSHWRKIPPMVQQAYDNMKSGANMVHATSTKFTLVSQLDLPEGAKLAKDLLEGCQHVATSALLLCATEAGTSMALQKSVQHTARAVVRTCIQLLQSFLVVSSLSSGGIGSKNTVAAPKTGAVWSACDAVQSQPVGNRSAVRRELLTFKADCNETIQEFQELLLESNNQTGTFEQNDIDNAGADVGWDGFLQGDGDGYILSEIPVVEAALAILKCSRGAINIALQSCESAGALEQEQQQVTDDQDQASVSAAQSSSSLSLLSPLLFVQSMHSKAREVGDGVTNFGSLLYSPLDYHRLQQQAQAQTKMVAELCRSCLEVSLTPNAILESLDKETTDLATTVQTMVQKRMDELNGRIQEVGATGDDDNE